MFIFWIYCPNLAKYSYGWLPLEQHHKFEKAPSLLPYKGKNGKNLALAFWAVSHWLHRVFIPKIVGGHIWPWYQNFWKARFSPQKKRLEPVKNQRSITGGGSSYKQGIKNRLALPIDKMLYIYLLCPHSEHQNNLFQSKQCKHFQQRN
jgi:hypothetical protein